MRIALPLALIALLGLAIPAPALGLETPLRALAAVGEEEAEEEQGEPEPESSEPEAEADPEAEEEAEEEEEAGPFPPAECLLRTARARVFAYASQDKLRLVVRYTSLAPASVSVDFRLAGGKGSLQLGQVKRRFARQGMFRLTERLSESRMDKAEAAKRFLVTLHMPATPSYCDRYYTRRLTIKRSVRGQVVWFQSDSIFGTG